MDNKALKAIESERKYQDEKWRNYPTHTNEEWGVIANEEAGEVARATMELWRNPDSKSAHLNLCQELIQYAAVITAWAEDAAKRSVNAVDFEQYAKLRDIQTATLINERIGRTVIVPKM